MTGRGRSLALGGAGESHGVRLDVVRHPVRSPSPQDQPAVVEGSLEFHEEDESALLYKENSIFAGMGIKRPEGGSSFAGQPTRRGSR